MNIKIGKYILDNEQQAIIENNDKYLLVVAGAGSGKTLTILGKIKYLLEQKNVSKDSILCLSFTNEASKSLQLKIKQEFNIDLKVYTFHKLALEILKSNKKFYNITSNETLKNIIYEYIHIDAIENIKIRKQILSYFNQKHTNKNKYFDFIQNNIDVEKLENLIETFIHLFKCNGYTLEDFSDFLKKSRKNIFKFRKEKLFFIIVINIYIKYSDYLKDNNEIDFDDSIIYATKEIKEGKLNSIYNYIIIDEYQDTSFIRSELIKSIINKCDSSLLAVGDDFQSIYHFSGCDLKLFIDFNEYYHDAKIMYIKSTYRNSNELIKIAGDFVMKNKEQLKKELRSNKSINYPIKLVYYSNIKKEFIKIISEIHKKSNSEILVLGRYNKDIYKVINEDFTYNEDKLIYKKNKDIKIKYLTIHKAKGLEADNVIIINLENSKKGFPSQIDDNKLLRYVTSNIDKYPYSEERRLFYVALTRTKNFVYLLVPKNESIFITELKKRNKKELEYIYPDNN